MATAIKTGSAEAESFNSNKQHVTAEIQALAISARLTTSDLAKLIDKARRALSDIKDYAFNDGLA
jgi:hypothetical protein